MWFVGIIPAQQPDPELAKFDRENKRISEMVQSVTVKQDEVIACLANNDALWKAGRREEAIRKKCE